MRAPEGSFPSTRRSGKQAQPQPPAPGRPLGVVVHPQGSEGGATEGGEADPFTGVEVGLIKGRTSDFGGDRTRGLPRRKTDRPPWFGYPCAGCTTGTPTPDWLRRSLLPRPMGTMCSTSKGKLKTRSGAGPYSHRCSARSLTKGSAGFTSLGAPAFAAGLRLIPLRPIVPVPLADRVGMARRDPAPRATLPSIPPVVVVAWR